MSETPDMKAQVPFREQDIRDEELIQVDITYRAAILRAFQLQVAFVLAEIPVIENSCDD